MNYGYIIFMFGSPSFVALLDYSLYQCTILRPTF